MTAVPSSPASSAHAPTRTELAAALTAALHPTAPPIAITFGAERPDGVPAFDEPMAPPAPDGRTGRVPAGCVFWMEGGIEPAGEAGPVLRGGSHFLAAS